MPKLTIHDQAVKRRKEDLRRQYGGFITLTDISRELGCRNYRTVIKAVGSLPSYMMTGKKLYDIADVAMMIESSRVPAEAWNG